MAHRDLPEIDPHPEALTKGDRLPLAYTNSLEQPATERKVLPEPTFVAAPEIVSPHWHGPRTPKAAQTGTKKPKSRVSKKHSRFAERKPSTPEACTPLRRLFDPATCKLIEAKNAGSFTQ